MDVWIIKETCIDNGYLRGIEIESDWSVIDVGAGLGDFTILAAATFTDGSVHAYEPYGQSYQLLEHNLGLNHIVGVSCFEEAAGRAGTRLSAMESSKEAVSTSFIETDVETSEPSSVPSVDLSQMLARLPGGICDLLKIDCEGCEFELLISAEAESLEKVLRITMETHDGFRGHSTSKLIHYLSTRGFTIRQEPNPVHSDLHSIYAER